MTITSEEVRALAERAKYVVDISLVDDLASAAIELSAERDRLAAELAEAAREKREETYAEWQQKRGMLFDKVDWAINEYDQFMLDDAYDAQRLLNRVIDGLRDARAFLARHEQENDHAD